MSHQILDQNNQPLSTTLLFDLQKEILSGEIPPSTKLTEQVLCKKYNVSRTPVREAFRQLEADGLIENIPNRGAFVIGLSNRDISDLFDLRCLLEVQTIEWAIQRMDSNYIADLKEIIDFMEFYTHKKDAEKVLYFNSMFHNKIYDGTNDRMLEKTLATYQTYLKHSAPPSTYTDDYLLTILAEHKSIFEAIEQRNVIAGKLAMEHHMNQSKRRRMARFL